MKHNEDDLTKEYADDVCNLRAYYDSRHAEISAEHERNRIALGLSVREALNALNALYDARHATITAWRRAKRDRLGEIYDFQMEQLRRAQDEAGRDDIRAQGPYG